MFQKNRPEEGNNDHWGLTGALMLQFQVMFDNHRYATNSSTTLDRVKI